MYYINKISSKTVFIPKMRHQKDSYNYNWLCVLVRRQRCRGKNETQFLTNSVDFWQLAPKLGALAFNLINWSGHCYEIIDSYFVTLKLKKSTFFNNLIDCSRLMNTNRNLMYFTTSKHFFLSIDIFYPQLRAVEYINLVTWSERSAHKGLLQKLAAGRPLSLARSRTMW